MQLHEWIQLHWVTEFEFNNLFFFFSLSPCVYWMNKKKYIQHKCVWVYMKLLSLCHYCTEALCGVIYQDLRWKVSFFSSSSFFCLRDEIAFHYHIHAELSSTFSFSLPVLTCIFYEWIMINKSAWLCVAIELD